MVPFSNLRQEFNTTLPSHESTYTLNYSDLQAYDPIQASPSDNYKVYSQTPFGAVAVRLRHV